MFVSVTTITCVNGDWPCQLEIAIFDPLPHITFNRSPKYLLEVITSSAPRGQICCNIWCKSTHWGFWANGWNKRKFYLFMYTFFGNSPTRQTRQRIFTLDGSNDANSRKGVSFVGFVDIATHFGGGIPKNPNLGGLNRHFQGKGAKYWKFHAIETLHRF